MKSVIKFLPVAAISALFLASCGGGEKKKDATKVDTTAQQPPVDTLLEQQTNLLPSPLQVAMIFDKSGLDFDASFTNKAENVSKYTSKFEKSINFGVYSADLAYAVLNEKSKEATQTIKIVRDLSSEIGLSTVFDSDDILVRFEKNINNQDSVIDLLVLIEEKTDDYIEENGEHELSNVMFAGAWIEGMYIGAQATVKQNKNDIGAKLSEQMIILENLIKGLEMGEKNADNESLVSNLKDLHNTYMGFESVKNLEGDDAYNVELKKDEIKVLSEKITNLRNTIVKA
ncbi:MAG: hypothetical protein ACOZCO_17640 [Bacteroidota bacterium]